MTGSDAAAAELGRHYLAGHLDAAELDSRLGRLFAEPGSAGDLLADLPSLEPPAPAAVRTRRRWGRRRHGESGEAQPDWLPTSERSWTPRPTG